MLEAQWSAGPASCGGYFYRQVFTVARPVAGFLSYATLLHYTFTLSCTSTPTFCLLHLLYDFFTHSRQDIRVYNFGLLTSSSSPSSPLLYFPSRFPSVSVIWVYKNLFLIWCLRHHVCHLGFLSASIHPLHPTLSFCQRHFQLPAFLNRVSSCVFSTSITLYPQFPLARVGPEATLAYKAKINGSGSLLCTHSWELLA